MSYDWKAAEAAAYLQGVRDSHRDLVRLQASVDLNADMAHGIDYTANRGQGAHDALERMAERLIEASEAYAAELAAWVELQAEAHGCINRLDDARYRAVLELYYVDAMPWEDVGDAIGYSTVWCKQLRMEALPAFWDVMPPRCKTMIPRAD